MPKTWTAKQKEEVGNRVARIIEREKTINAAARNPNIDRSTLAGVVKGKTMPSADLLQCLAKHYNANAHWIVTGVGAMYIPQVEAELQRAIRILDASRSGLGEALDDLHSDGIPALGKGQERKVAEAPPPDYPTKQEGAQPEVV